MQGANLSGAQLQGADLIFAQLQEASLSGADLRVGQLQGANLSGAQLEGTQLYGVTVEGKIGNEKVEANFANTNWKEADFRPTLIEEEEIADWINPEEEDERLKAWLEENFPY